MNWKRPDVLEGRTIALKTPACGTFYLTLNHQNNKLVEVRMTLGRSGNCLRGILEVMAILISTMLQSNIPREKLAKTLEKAMETNCGNRIYYGDNQYYTSCVDFCVKIIVEDMLAREEVSVNE